MSQSDSEKRSFTRVPLKVKIFISEGEGEGLLYFFTSNISLGGVFIISDLLLESGTSLKMQFILPLPGGNVTVTASGVVRWQQYSASDDDGFMPPGMGVRFEKLDTDSRRFIERFISSHLTDMLE